MAKKTQQSLFVFNDDLEAKCKLPDEWFVGFEEIGKDEMRILVLFALVGNNEYEISRVSARLKGLTAKSRKEIIVKLNKLGFLERDKFYFWHDNYVLSQEKLISVILYALDRYPECVEEIERQKVEAKLEYQSLWRMLRDYYKGSKDLSEYKESRVLEYFNFGMMLHPFFETDLLDVMITAFLDNQFFGVINVALTRAYSDDDERSKNVICRCWSLYDMFYARKGDTILRFTINDYIIMYEFMLIGCSQRTFTKQANLFQLMTRAVAKLYQGEDKESLSLFEEALKINNKSGGVVKNVLLNQMMCFYLLLCYAKNKEVKKASVFANKTQLQEEAMFIPALLVAWKIILDDTKSPSDEHIKKMLGLKISPLSQLFGRLFAEFDKESGIAVPRTIKNRAVNCALLRYELSAVGGQCEDKEELRKTLGGEPILSSFRAKPKWEALLEGLKTITAIKGNEGTKEKSAERIVYVVGRTYCSEKAVFVYRQKLLKSGKWGKPSVVSTNSYVERKLNCLEQIDHDVIKAISQAKLRYIEDSFSCDLILPNLVGSDKVFYLDKNKDEFLSVDVVEEKPYIRLDKNAGGYVVTSNVPMNNEDEKLGNAIVAWNGNTHATVYRLTAFEREAICEFKKQGIFPLEAEKYLQEFIYAVENHLEVHSDLIQGGSLLDKKKATSRITLRLEPTSEGCLLQVYIVPLENSKLRLLPGRGLEVIYDEVEGKRCQVERDLKAEKHCLEPLQAYLMENAGSMIELGETLALDLEVVLSLLQFVGENSDNYQVEWPEGKSYRLKALHAKGANSVKIVSKENWFEVEGDLKFDGDKKMSVLELMRLMSQWRVGNRFVRLNDEEFIALNDSLAKQLQKLEKIAQIDNRRVRINRLQVGELAKIVQSADSAIKSDSSIQTLADNIQKAVNMQVTLPKGLQAELRDYQRIGYEWMSRLASWGAGACLADDMGLGKTVQAIAFLLNHAKEGPSMVVAPTSVVFNWQKELQRFAPTLNVHIFNEANNRADLIDGLKNGDILITTYGLIVREEEMLKAKKWNVICLDEAHTIKNRTTKMSQVAMELQAQRRLLLTGTPVQNHLGELWNLFQFFNPGLLGSYEWFNRRYIQPIEQDHNEERRTQLRKLVQPFILRRTKGEVVEELPDKIEMTRQVELTDDEQIAYEALRMEAQKSLETEKKVSVSVLSNITRLREAACSVELINKNWNGGSSKLEDMCSLVAQITEEGNRVLIFSQFTSFLSRAKEVVDKMGIDSFYLDGSTPMNKRKTMVEQFQQGEKSVFFISLKAGGLGLNLTGANYVIHLDPWWNPAIEQQATDRAYRIGQNQKVTVYHLIAKNTIEEKILRLHQSKRDIADSILEGANTSHALNLDDLKYLLEL